MRSRLFWRRSAAAAGSYAAATLGFLGTVVALHIFSRETFGRFALVVAATMLVQSLLDLTVEEALVKFGFRYVAREDWGRLRRLFTNAIVFKVAGVTFGSLLGVFLLGLLTTRRVKDGANVAAMIVMALVNLALLVLSEMKVLAFGWSWLVVLGTVGTILLALTFSATARRDSSRPS